jgi:8-oxo-dGTP pyrophosphatase MutT (NUDIX family)
MRAGGNQIIPRPAAVWVRPNNPFRTLDHSVLRSTEQLIARIESAAGNVSQVDVPQGAKASAVLVPIFDGEHGPEVVLTRRSQQLTNHKGEVSFPGGRIDANETAVDAALRESREEINLDTGKLRIVGQLGAISTYVSSSHIVPVVAHLHNKPELDISNEEVERAFSVPLIDLVRDDTYAEEHWGTAPNTYQLHFFHLDEETIWGATGKMLHQLINIALLKY